MRRIASPTAKQVHVGMAQPQTPVRTVTSGDGHGRTEGVGVLQIERERHVGPDVFEEVIERGQVAGERGAIDRSDAAPVRPATHHAVVVEDDLAVPSKPRVTFEPCCAQASGQIEGTDGVLVGVGSSTAMGKADRWLEKCWQAGPHGDRSHSRASP